MLKEIYNYLLEYGFTEAEIKQIENKNGEIFYAILSNVTNNVAFFEDLGLTKEEFITLVNSNSLIITCSSKRKEAFNELYYNQLKFTKEEIKNMLFINKYLYNMSPIQISEYVKQNNITKEMILSNPNMLLEI